MLSAQPEFSPVAASAEDTLLTQDGTTTQGLAPTPLVLTVLWHPDSSRWGEQAVLGPSGRWSLNRFAPLFVSRAAGSASPQPLLHGGISRSNLHLQADDSGLSLSADDGLYGRLEVNGQALMAPQRWAWEQLPHGIVIQPCSKVLLLAHRTRLLPLSPDPQLLGQSQAMEQLRRQVKRIAQSELPVLIHGETGTGKELVAQALHRLGPRANQAWVAVNMATLGEGLAAAELFGAARGAYTGAQTQRSGLWAEAEGGTLFLDEIGDCPAPVQPMLLRAIETSEYRPLGAAKPVAANVRLLAATDRSLEAGQFNQPLLRRLQTFILHTPALRERREDLGLLIRQMWQASGGQADHLGQVPGPLARAICLHNWPGNVRQLLQAVRRLCLDSAIGLWPEEHSLLGEALCTTALSAASAAKEGVPAGFVQTSVALVAASTGGSLAASSTETSPGSSAHFSASASSASASAASASPPATKPADAAGERVSEAPPTKRAWQSTASIRLEDLRAALYETGWELSAAADRLGVSRPSMYNLMARHQLSTSADHLSADALVNAVQTPGASLIRLARQFEVPREALRRRIKAIGLPRPPEDLSD